MKKSILILLSFIGAQLLSMLLLSLFAHFPKLVFFDVSVASSSNAYIGMSVILSNVIAALFVFFIGFPRFRRVDIKTLLFAVACSVPAIILTNMLVDLLHLPDLNSDMFDKMKTSVLCLFALVIVGPVCEELVFRAGIMEQLIKKGMNPAVAIVTSAVVFGIVHVNPAQVLGAFLFGLLFGWIFYVSGNILTSIVAHIFNNGLAMALMFFSQNDEKSIIEEVGGVLPFIAISAFCFVSMIILFMKFKAQINRK